MKHPLPVPLNKLWVIASAFVGFVLSTSTDPAWAFPASEPPQATDQTIMRTIEQSPAQQEQMSIQHTEPERQKYHESTGVSLRQDRTSHSDKVSHNGGETAHLHHRHP